MPVSLKEIVLSHSAFRHAELRVYADVRIISALAEVHFR
jgi:hypothetical protein